MLAILSALMQLSNARVSLQTPGAWYILVLLCSVAKLSILSNVPVAKKNLVLMFYVQIFNSLGSKHGMGKFLVISFAKNSL